MGSSKKQTVSYWYHPFFQLALHEGPFDKLLKIRGGDVDAWVGELTASGSIEVNAPNLWGGEEKEGGIQGTFDVMFGEMDAEPNAFIQTAMGPDPSNHNGVALLQFNSGRYGAGNPYPKPISVLTERILKGWQDDVCWYPEAAPVPLGVVAEFAIYFCVDLSGSMNEPGSGGRTRLENMQLAIIDSLNVIRGSLSTGGRVDVAVCGFGEYPDARQSIVRHAATAADLDDVSAWVASRTADYTETYFTSGLIDAPAFFAGSPSTSRIIIFVTDGQPGLVTPPPDAMTIAVEAGDIVDSIEGVRCYGINIDLANTTYTAIVANEPDVAVVVGGDPTAIRNVILAALTVSPYGMNPAHVIYDSLSYLQGEPIASIDDASFSASAARLFAEGFGICTKYNHAQETIEQFRQRVLDIIGAECSRYNGKWYLDLIRELSPAEIDELPVLTDDDILDWQEDPTNRDDAVNQVAVKWFDPETKQSRITPHVHALAAINTLGSVNAEVRDYPELPVEGLANRVALRDLRNKSTPTGRFSLTTNRTPYNWRKGHAFRLQSPKRGIAEMVCRVADIDRGTLQSGAIRLVSVQDTFAMPATAYVVGSPPELPPSPVPEPIEHQVLLEAPYLELAGVLSAADLSALDADAGFVLAVGVKPGNGQGFALLTRPAGGEFERIGTFDWCPSALVAEGAGYTDTAFTLTGGSLLARVEVGTAALWGEEVVRVDGMDLVTGAIVLGRGCADTVPHQHAPGERIYFFDAWSATDQVEYATAETIEAKLLPRTGTQELTEDAVTALSVTIDQRAARPYPPANVRINGEPYPTSVVGDAEVTAFHRDRVLQADQLVDQSVGDIGPEPGTTYVVRNVNAATEVETYFADGITAFPHVVPAGDLVVGNRLEVYAVRDGLESWQRVAVEFTIGAVLQTEDFEAITAEDGDPILME